MRPSPSRRGFRARAGARSRSDPSSSSPACRRRSARPISTRSRRCNPSSSCQHHERSFIMAHGARGTGGDITSGYAPVNGLQMYYEIHGAGQPLVVLHGAYMTIELMGEYIPAFARTRQVIAVELRGHGHTADIDRPITYESLADDTAALLRFLGIDQADV